MKVYLIPGCKLLFNMRKTTNEDKVLAKWFELLDNLLPNMHPIKKPVYGGWEVNDFPGKPEMPSPISFCVVFGKGCAFICRAREFKDES